MVQSTSLGFRQPQGSATVRPAGQVSQAPAAMLQASGRQLQQVADKYSAYLEAEAAQEADLIWTQAQVDWTRTLKEGAKTAGSGFAATTLKDYDAYVKRALGTAPLRSLDDLEHRFAKYRIGLEASAIQAEAAAKARARAARAAQIKENIGFAAMEGTHIQHFYDVTEGASDADKSYAFKIWSDTVLSEGSPDDVEYYRMALEDADMFDEYMTPTQKRTYLKSIQAKQDATTKDRVKEHSAVITETATQIELSGNTDAGDTVLETLKTDPEIPDSSKQDLVDFATQSFNEATTLYEVRTNTAEENTAELNRRKVAASDADPKPGEVESLNKFSTALQKHAEGLTEPVGYASLVSEQIRELEKDARAAEDDPGTVVDESAVAAERYFSALDAQLDHWGLPLAGRTYLRPDDAARLADQLNQDLKSAGGVSVSEFISKYGEYSDAVLAQLIDKGLRDSVIASMELRDNFGLVTDIQQSAVADKDELEAVYKTRTNKTYTKGEEDFRTNAALKELRKIFLFNRPGGDTAWGKRVDTMFRTYAWRVANEEYDPNDVSGIVGEFFPFHTIMERNNMIAVIPLKHNKAYVVEGINQLRDPAIFRKFLADRMSDADLAEWTALDNAAIDRELAVQIMSGSGVWVSNDNQTGMVLGGYDRYGDWVAIVDGDKNPVEISYGDLATLGSGPVQARIEAEEDTRASGTVGTRLPRFKGPNDPRLLRAIEAGSLVKGQKVLIPSGTGMTTYVIGSE